MNALLSFDKLESTGNIGNAGSLICAFITRSDKQLHLAPPRCAASNLSLGSAYEIYPRWFTVQRTER